LPSPRAPRIQRDSQPRPHEIDDAFWRPTCACPFVRAEVRCARGDGARAARSVRSGAGAAARWA
jgi:hypothetical protein